MYNYDNQQLINILSNSIFEMRDNLTEYPLIKARLEGIEYLYNKLCDAMTEQSQELDASRIKYNDVIHCLQKVEQNYKCALLEKESKNQDQLKQILELNGHIVELEKTRQLKTQQEIPRMDKALQTDYINEISNDQTQVQKFIQQISKLREKVLQHATTIRERDDQIEFRCNAIRNLEEDNQYLQELYQKQQRDIVSFQAANTMQIEGGNYKGSFTTQGSNKASLIIQDQDLKALEESNIYCQKQQQQYETRYNNNLQVHDNESLDDQYADISSGGESSNKYDDIYPDRSMLEDKYTKTRANTYDTQANMYERLKCSNANNLVLNPKVVEFNIASNSFEQTKKQHHIGINTSITNSHEISTNTINPINKDNKDTQTDKPSFSCWQIIPYIAATVLGYAVHGFTKGGSPLCGEVTPIMDNNIS